MLTPGASWGGVNLFWPLNSYVGGFGKIWWWNNYDIFLIICSIIFLNTFTLFMSSIFKINSFKFMVVVFIIGVALSVYQVNTRNYDFAYSENTNKYQEYELASKQIQKDILGIRLYNVMENFDNKLKIYF